MVKATRVLAKPANYADLFEARVQEDLARLAEDLERGGIAAEHPMMDKKGQPDDNKVRNKKPSAVANVYG